MTRRLTLAVALLVAAAPLVAQSAHQTAAAPVTIAAVSAADAPMPAAPTAAPEPAPALSIPAEITTPPATTDPDAMVVTRVASLENELPVGTLIKVRLNQTLSTRSTATGAPFDATVEEAVLRDGKIIIPVGSEMHGSVLDINGGARFFGRAALRLQPFQVVLPDGSRYVLHAQVIDTDEHRSTRVNKDGTLVSPDHASSLAIFSLSTVSAASAGAVFGGWPGALIGAGAGAGVSTAQWLRHDRETMIPVESKVIFSLTTPMPMTPLH